MVTHRSRDQKGFTSVHITLSVQNIAGQECRKYAKHLMFDHRYTCVRGHLFVNPIAYI